MDDGRCLETQSVICCLGMLSGLVSGDRFCWQGRMTLCPFQEAPWWQSGQHFLWGVTQWLWNVPVISVQISKPVTVTLRGGFSLPLPLGPSPSSTWLRRGLHCVGHSDGNRGPSSCCLVGCQPLSSPCPCCGGLRSVPLAGESWCYSQGLTQCLSPLELL